MLYLLISVEEHIQTFEKYSKEILLRDILVFRFQLQTAKTVYKVNMCSIKAYLLQGVEGYKQILILIIKWLCSVIYWRCISIDGRPFPFSVFSLVSETSSTWTMIIQNTEAWRLEYDPECHLAQISLRKGAGEHVLHCDGNLKGLDIHRVWAKMLCCNLLWEQRNAIARQLDYGYIFILK